MFSNAAALPGVSFTLGVEAGGRSGVRPRASGSRLVQQSHRMAAAADGLVDRQAARRGGFVIEANTP